MSRATAPSSVGSVPSPGAASPSALSLLGRDSPEKKVMKGFGEENKALVILFCSVFSFLLLGESPIEANPKSLQISASVRASRFGDSPTLEKLQAVRNLVISYKTPIINK